MSHYTHDGRDYTQGEQPGYGGGGGGGGHGYGRRYHPEPIKLDPTKEKLIMRPNAPIPKFFPAPTAIQVIPIYDDAGPGMPPPQSAPAHRPTYDRSETIRPMGRSRSHTPGRAVYTDSEYDYSDDDYDHRERRGRGRSYSQSYSRSQSRGGGGGYDSYPSDYDSDRRGGYRSRGRSMSSSSGSDRYRRGRSRSRYTSTDDEGAYYAGHARPGGTAYAGSAYESRARPPDAVTPSGKPYSQTPQPQSGVNAHVPSQGYAGSMYGGSQVGNHHPQSASASAYALALSQAHSQHGGAPSQYAPSHHSHAPSHHHHGGGAGSRASVYDSRARPPDALTPSGKPYSQAPQPHSLPVQSASHSQAHAQAGYAPSHHTHHSRGSSSVSTGGGSRSGSGTSVHHFTVQSPSPTRGETTFGLLGHTPSHAASRMSYAPSHHSHHSYAPSQRAPSHAPSRPQSHFSAAPSRLSHAPSAAAHSVLSSTPSALSAAGLERGIMDAIQRYLKELPTNPNFCYSSCKGRKKAVCIGINYIGQKDELRGCANDARNMRKFLMTNYGFKSSDILLLLDDDKGPTGGAAKPTKREMFNAMAWLVKDAKMHDSLFFHYSGHGGQSPDASGMEKDGMDETIYPMDYDKDGDIIDDERTL
ncbi:hypothetical protein CPC08DRAFT_709250 [Agrocybe pediades]|nr:hypothetical protein CPC08DRAFT_709250 [Agrocybe pediades]